MLKSNWTNYHNWSVLQREAGSSTIHFQNTAPAPPVSCSNASHVLAAHICGNFFLCWNEQKLMQELSRWCSVPLRPQSFHRSELNTKHYRTYSQEKMPANEHKIWLTLFLTPTLVISCNCRYTLGPHLPEFMWKPTQCRLYDVSRSPVSFLRMLSLLFLWIRTCTWTVVAWMLCFLCSLIPVELTGSKSTYAAQTQLEHACGVSSAHPLGRPTSADWRKERHWLICQGNVPQTHKL